MENREKLYGRTTAILNENLSLFEEWVAGVVQRVDGRSAGVPEGGMEADRRGVEGVVSGDQPRTVWSPLMAFTKMLSGAFSQMARFWLAEDGKRVETPHLHIAYRVEG